MEKIIYVVNFMPDEYNSVTEILHNLIGQAVEKKNIAVLANGWDFEVLRRKKIDGIDVICGESLPLGAFFRDKTISIREKCFCLQRRFLKFFLNRLNKEAWERWSKKEYIKHILKLEKPDCVCFILFDPKVSYAEACIESNVSYIQILFDTYIERPNIEKEKTKEEESYIIDHAKAYFVPSFFADGYQKEYGSCKFAGKIKAYDLPLLVSREKVQNAFQKNTEKYDYAYFGQMQSFRNADIIKKSLAELGITMDVFPANTQSGDQVFRGHEAVAGEQLWETVAGSRFLVAFDNSVPYDRYLPSKVYLYVSFTKPIIVFGDNECSALKEFLNDYPLYYYQNIHESTEGLVRFIQSTDSDGFDEKLYSKYEQYLPENALKQVMNELS